MHVPVLLEEAVSMLALQPDGVYVDCTVGGGGHLACLVQKLGEKATIIGIDKDAKALEEARKKLADVSSKLILIHGDFRRLQVILKMHGISEIHGIVLDLGVSSFQLDDASRGFSYQEEGPLDMRMNTDQQLSAWHLVNEWSEERLALIIRELGEERYARRIAREIVRERQLRPINTTFELVEVIKRAVPAQAKKDKHPARRTFQALRIAVNEELEALEEVLPQAVEVLASEGRIAVITFHSLEDRIVKTFFKRESLGCLCPPDQPVCTCNHRARLKIVTKRPITPTEAELARNPRSRSAKLRIAEKI
ncbi:MAG TPA: 16S rRNA (cytosine(1402)-N(4))-methyltransferase RsmH [Syntrophothermus lipocalidus]|uniref:16S rRNA (cytosine(1402)-N(4))-methyltransferase RsmH n=1 Tax=Syntrophothermus sp. TaxID=2736299 RepID=UPI0017ED6580|nr:16S rRNA (cytosine(1402)-N(4))-methyltransferase RsmH [Syntrophothermus sp.]NSW83746.1 16S rRNA (cytosine(1402)-N(4))-methyltransferase RsmH [Syntrophothermus sp.]HHV76964.1 16S rRNA (cytosine(1402)-N(4))-methyltransferase RsmH [Syntrophothermus lipocalidus]